MLALDTKIEQVHRVGKTTAGRLQRLGIETVRDLLFYFPYRYEDYRAATPVASLKDGMAANVVGQVELIHNKRSPRKRMYITEAIVSDETGSIKVVWFNQPFIAKNISSGDKISLAGKAEEDMSGPVMKSPVYEKLTPQGAIHTRGLVPVYHLTANLTQKQIRFLIKQTVESAGQIEDWLPDKTRGREKLIPLPEAVRKIHFPDSYDDIGQARDRLAFDELFLIQLRSLLAKSEIKNARAPEIEFHEAGTRKFVDSLPFKLTDDQKKSSWAILKDMEKTSPMARLLEGDVGNGKTLVAVIALLNAALNKKQGVLMVPTEILAQQHFDSISNLLADFDVNIALMTRTGKKIFKKTENRRQTPLRQGYGGQAAGDKKEIMGIKPKEMAGKIAGGEVDIIIGTHALIQEKIEYDELGLVVVDEQHRFGVEQRKKLMRKSGRSSFMPHLLSMTATPIPRSLALALFGELDISVIREMPKGRKPIITRVAPDDKRGQAYGFVREQIRAGRQAFVVCPLIDPSDKTGAKSVKEEFKKLDEKIFKDIPVAMLHGKLKAKDKEDIMADFKASKTKILVSTSVVEVGVDVPNATIMMIEGADRFGLAQLHQFRGRIGRGGHQSYCFLFTDSQNPRTLQRLNAMVKYNNGFDLAKMDLELRGPGEIYGTAQKGFPELKVASLFDHELASRAREAAEKVLVDDDDLKKHPLLKDKLGQWAEQYHFE